MQEQLLILQNQLTKEAREEFEKLVSSVQKNSEHSEELKSELAKYFQSKVDERVSKIKEREQEVTDEEVEEVWNDGPWGSRKLDVLRNSSVPSLFVNYKGHNVYTYPNRKGYFWEGVQYARSSDVYAAIDAQMDAK